MPLFELLLKFAPSFHRHCSIRVEGELTAQATFEAPATGLLPRVVQAVEVDAPNTAELLACSLSMLQSWDKRWSAPGLDGISVEGTFDTSDSDERAFSLWSPPRSSGAHAMLSAALSCFPPELCSGAAGNLLEIVRSHFGLQPAVFATGQTPLRLRLAPWLHRTHASEVEQKVRSLPDEAELIVDASGVERFGPALASVLPMAYLRKRGAQVRWVVRQDAAEALLVSGVAPSAVEIVSRPPLTPTGDPIVLGGLVVSSAGLISLAWNGAKLELTRALRQEHRITVTQASQAAAELVDLVRTIETSTVTTSRR